MLVSSQGDMSSSGPDRAPATLGIFFTGIILSTICVSLRLWVRGRIDRNVGSDDWIVLASLILLYVSLGFTSASFASGLGQHKDAIGPAASANALEMMWIGNAITPFAEAAAKLSITIMLMRTTTSKMWKRFLRTAIGLFLIITFCSPFAFLACQPVSFLWDPSPGGGNCNVSALEGLIYIQGVMSAAHDVVLATSTMLLLWKLQESRSSKWLFCGFLTLCFFTAAAGIVRTTYIPELFSTSDPTSQILDFLIWKFVSLPLTLILPSLPTLLPLYSKLASRGSDRSNSRLLGPYAFRTIRKTTNVQIRIESTSASLESGSGGAKGLREAWEGVEEG